MGDSHQYTVDNPYDGLSAFQAIRPGFTPVAPNITRVIVEGSTVAPNRFEYLRLTVSPTSGKNDHGASTPPFRWERVDYTFN